MTQNDYELREEDKVLMLQVLREMRQEALEAEEARLRKKGFSPAAAKRTAPWTRPLKG